MVLNNEASNLLVHSPPVEMKETLHSMQLTEMIVERAAVSCSNFQIFILTLYILRVQRGLVRVQRGLVGAAWLSFRVQRGLLGCSVA